MALIKCDDCGKDVSTMAPACPHCGRPVDQSAQPMDETMSAVAAGKRIACPDESCTGIIKESGQCGTCGLHHTWEDESGSAMGATLAQPEAPDTTKGVAIGLILAVVFLIMVLSGGKSTNTDLDKPDAPPSREQQIKAGFSSWNGAHYGLEKLIKKAMNNPDSYEHVKTIYSEEADGLVVTTQYRGTNGFGGVVTNKIMAKTDLNGNVIAILYQGS